MGFKIKIVKTEGPLAKADENEILRTLAGAFFEHDGYCKNLFTTEFLSWVATQIDNDICPDLWSEYRNAWKDHGECTQENMKLTAEIGNLKNALDVKRATLAEALDENKILKQQVDAFKADLAELEDAREALANQEAMIEEMRREMAILGQAHGEQRAALEKARQDILVLKARLYDLEHPENAASPAAEQDPLRFLYQQSA